MNTKGIIAVLVGITILGSVAFAQPGGKQRGERRQEIAQKLNLTPAQIDQLKANREQFKSQNQAALSEIKALREQLKEYIKNHDEANAKATLAQIKAKMQALKPAREALQQQNKGILTPEQQAEFEKLRAERKQKIEERRKEWKENHRKNG
jgi:Spy/CpxP family protein refolding chaperone